MTPLPRKRKSKVKFVRLNKFSSQPIPHQTRMNPHRELFSAFLLEKITLLDRCAAVSELLKDPKALKVLSKSTLKNLREYRNRLLRRLSGRSTKPSPRSK